MVAKQDHTRSSIFSCGFSYLLALPGSNFFVLSHVFVRLVGSSWFGLFGFLSSAHPAEVSMQFNKGSWNLTLLPSLLNLQVSVWLHSFCSLLLSLLGSHLIIYLIYILVVWIFHPQGLYCAFVSLLYKAIVLHIVFHAQYPILTSTSSSVIPVSLVTLPTPASPPGYLHYRKEWSLRWQ